MPQPGKTIPRGGFYEVMPHRNSGKRKGQLKTPLEHAYFQKRPVARYRTSHLRITRGGSWQDKTQGMEVGEFNHGQRHGGHLWAKLLIIWEKIYSGVG